MILIRSSLALVSTPTQQILFKCTQRVLRERTWLKLTKLPLLHKHSRNQLLMLMLMIAKILMLKSLCNQRPKAKAKFKKLSRKSQIKSLRIQSQRKHLIPPMKLLPNLRKPLVRQLPRVSRASPKRPLMKLPMILMRMPKHKINKLKLMPLRSNKTLLSKFNKILPRRLNQVRLWSRVSTALPILTKLKIKHNWSTQIRLKLSRPTQVQMSLNL